MERITYTACVICLQNCGLRVTTRDDKVVKIEPDQENTYSWRDFCVKGATAHEVQSHPLRLRSPMKRVGHRYIPVPYADAVSEVAAALRRIIDLHGPHALATYIGNPTAGYFGASAFLGAMMDAVGSHNRYWVGSIDQNAFHYVSEQMFGTAWAILQDDIDAVDCLMLVGANPAISDMGWLGHVPDGWRRLLKRVAAGAQLVVVDPRRTETARHATVHLQPLPEEDWALLLGMVRVILQNGWENVADCMEADGIEELRVLASGASLELLSARCDIEPAAITEVARSFAQARGAICISRTGPGQGRNGALTHWLAEVLNIITGRIDRPGGRYFNPYPVNIIEVAARLFPPVTTPSRVRNLPTVGGFHALAELPDEILTPGQDQVRALFMHGGNPVVSGPDGARFDAAMQELELFVSIDMFQRESHRHAHWLIPGMHFLERDELPVIFGTTCDEGFIQMMKQAVPPPPGVRPEWEFFRDVAAAIGKPLFDGQIEAHPDVLARMLLSFDGHITFEQARDAPHGLRIAGKEFGHFRRSLKSANRRMQLTPEPLTQLLASRLLEPLRRTDLRERPFQVISRRRKHMMNSWLVETTARKMKDARSDVIELNTSDAVHLGIASGDEVVVCSNLAEVIAIALVSEEIRPGVVVMQQGWGSRLFDPTTGLAPTMQGLNRNVLVSADDLDPLTSVPRLNGTPVSLRRASVS